MGWIIYLIICGTIAAIIASNKGRNAIGWFFGGFFLGLVGIIIVAVLSNLKAEKAYRLRVAEETRRLREQVRQEQMKSESYRQYTMQRLDTHDGLLNVNTRSLAQGTGESPQMLQWDADAAAPPADPGEQLWYYEAGGESLGPVSADAIRTLLSNRGVAPTNLVWTEGMAQWAPIREVPAFRPPAPRTTL